MTLHPGAFSRPASGVQPSAVHFDGNTWLTNNSLVQTDAPYFSMFFWFQLTTTFSGNYIWSADPFDFETNMQLGGNGAQIPQYDLTLFDHLGNNGLSAFNATAVAYNTNWHWMLIGADLNHGPGLKKAQVLFDGVDRSTVNNFGAAQNLQFNGFNFFVGQDGFSDGWFGNIAQFWYAPINILDNTGVVPPATQSMFVSGGHPQSPSGFPAGAVILFDGNHTTFGNNQGSGGSFALTGAFTDVPGPT